MEDREPLRPRLTRRASGTDVVIDQSGTFLPDKVPFLNLTEDQQAERLLAAAHDALVFFEPYRSIFDRIAFYLECARGVTRGDFSKTETLLIFMQDPAMKDSFAAFFEQIKADESAVAALEIVSFACGFVCRVFASRSGIVILPDPVLESLPDLFLHYEDRAKSLGLRL